MQRKQVAFDLDTSALKVYYPSDHWRYAYEVIKAHMRKHGFSWQQGSVYISEYPMGDRQVTSVLRKMVQENPWLNVCMRDCRQTNIGREHNQSHLFDKTAKILTWEELKAQAMANAITELQLRQKQNLENDSPEL